MHIQVGATFMKNLPSINMLCILFAPLKRMQTLFPRKCYCIFWNDTSFKVILSDHIPLFWCHLQPIYVKKISIFLAYCFAGVYFFFLLGFTHRSQYIVYRGLVYACMSIITLLEHDWQLTFGLWPCDLERSRSRSWGQVKVKFQKCWNWLENHPGGLRGP